MNESRTDQPPVDLSDGSWDLRVAFIEKRQLWWWSAWQATTSTERYGFASTRAEAWSAMNMTGADGGTCLGAR